MSILSGRELGRYRIQQQVGKGGMGEVYRARDLELDRDVAVKVLPDAVADNPDRLRRFQREARAVARLSHPNILEIHDVGEDGGMRFMVTELLQGESLREALDAKALPWRECVEIGTAVARGLAAAHDQGVIHRDIKPENIFVTSDRQVKLLDFGLACFESWPAAEAGSQMSTVQATAAGTILGTPGYMSPEQIRAQRIDHRTDFFSLGCVLYEMAAGRRAFSGGSVADTLSAVLGQDPAKLSDLGVLVPAELDRIVRRCLAKDPRDRYPSAAELVADLEAIQEDARPGEPASPPALLRRAGMGVSFGRGALVLVIAAPIVILAWWTTRGPPGQVDGATAQPPAIHSVAIGSFENLTGDAGLDFWERSLPEIVTTALSESEHVRIVGTGPEAQGVASGALLRAGDVLRLELRLRDEATGKYTVSRSEQAAGSEDLQEAANRAVQGVRDHLELAILRERFPLRAWAAEGTSSAEVFRRFNEALDLRFRGDFESAASVLEAVLATDPGYMNARIYLLKNYSAVGRREEADRLLEEVYAQSDRLSLRQRYTIETIRAWDNKEAFKSIEYLRQLAELDPDDREAWYWLGIRYTGTEQYEKAIDPFERFLDLQSRQGPEMKAPYPYFFLADAYLETGQPARALEVAERGLALVPHRALWQLAQVACSASGDQLQAANYQKLWSEDMLSEVCGEECVALNLGDLNWAYLRDFERAEAEYRRSLEIAPGYVPGMFRLARLLIFEDLGVREGMDLIERVINTGYKNDDVRVAQGRGYYRLGDQAKAVEILERTWDERRSYDHRHKIFLEEARNALAAQGETTAVSASAQDG